VVALLLYVNFYLKLEKLSSIGEEKYVGFLTSADKGRTITAICCTSATGYYVQEEAKEDAGDSKTHWKIKHFE